MTLEELRQFHTVRRASCVAVTIQKSTTPMLWLDTSVLIDLAKAQNGERTEPVRAKRLARLHSVVRRAVRDEKLICPEWDQSTEYEGKRLAAEIQRIVSDLSCGAHCTPHAGVKDRQVAIGLKAYLARSSTMHVPADIHFYHDPLQAIREAKSNGYIVEAEIPKPREWLDKADRDKIATREAVEDLRQQYTAQKQTFEQQLELERIGESDSMMIMVDDYIKKGKAGMLDMWTVFGIEGFMLRVAEWQRLGGPGGDFISSLSGVYSFMRSPYYWELPIQDVGCRLSADLCVKQSPVKIGDSKDVDHLATSIPVAQYVVADNAMVDCCRRLKLGEKWNTRIYSTRTLDDLSDEILSL